MTTALNAHQIERVQRHRANVSHEFRTATPLAEATARALGLADELDDPQSPLWYLAHKYQEESA